MTATDCPRCGHDHGSTPCPELGRPMTDTLPLLLPDVPGKVHGIVSLDPPTVQCDGCCATYSAATMARAVIDSEFHFNPRREHDKRRLCLDCAKESGWQR